MTEDVPIVIPVLYLIYMNYKGEHKDETSQERKTQELFIKNKSKPSMQR